MKTITKIKEMQGIVDELRISGKRVGLVPTMGSLHEGHMSLVDQAKKLSDVCVISIFVNPTQFGRGEDFDKYPRDIGKDEKMAEARGVDFVFAPARTEMYPEEPQTYIEVQKVSESFEGEFRPGHFKGVATVVAKLFNIVKPHVAIFGQKDAQQAFIIKKMVRDGNFDVNIVVAPIVREQDGLAMSSRNVFLSPEERKKATVLFRSLKIAESMIAGGERDLVKIRSAIVRLINSESDGKIDYASFVDPANFEKVEDASLLDEVLALLAVRFGQTRLIDNMSYRIKPDAGRF